MPKPIHVVLGVLALLAAGSVAWLIRVVTRPEPVAAAVHRPAPPAAVAPALAYTAEPIGRAEGDHPAISDLFIADLDGDGLPDVVVSDATENQLSWIRQSPRGTWSETVLPVQASGPVRLIAGEFTGDGKMDLLVGCRGGSESGDDRTGQLLLIEHPADTAGPASRTLLGQVWPVVDVALLSAQRDGAIALVVATAGRQEGQLHFVERTASGDVRSEVLATGGRMIALAVPPRSGGPATFAVLEEGERDLVRVYRRTPAGAWVAETVGTAPEPGWEGTMLAWADVNRDGAAELVVANGDRERRYPDPKGGQGLHWLAPTGASRELHPLGSLPGVHAFAVADLNGDGRPDLVGVAAALQPLARDAATAVVWINDGSGGFARAPLPAAVEPFAALAVGDLDGNGVPAIVTGTNHTNSAAEQSRRVTLWRRH